MQEPAANPRRVESPSFPDKVESVFDRITSTLRETKKKLTPCKCHWCMQIELQHYHRVKPSFIFYNYVQETTCISVAILCSPNHANKLLWKMNYIIQQISLMKSVRPFAWIFDTSGCALARDTWGGGGEGPNGACSVIKLLTKRCRVCWWRKHIFEDIIVFSFDSG